MINQINFYGIIYEENKKNVIYINSINYYKYTKILIIYHLFSLIRRKKKKQNKLQYLHFIEYETILHRHTHYILIRYYCIRDVIVSLAQHHHHSFIYFELEQTFLKHYVFSPFHRLIKY